jgi:hypothetical protein
LNKEDAMSKFPIRGNPSKIRTDAGLEREADRIVDEMIEALAKESAEKMWDTMKKSLTGGGLKFTGSASDKSKFIRETTRKITHNSDAAEKLKLKRKVVDELKRQLAAAGE